MVCCTIGQRLAVFVCLIITFTSAWYTVSTENTDSGDKTIIRYYASEIRSDCSQNSEDSCEERTTRYDDTDVDGDKFQSMYKSCVGMCIFLFVLEIVFQPPWPIAILNKGLQVLFFSIILILLTTKTPPAYEELQGQCDGFWDQCDDTPCSSWTGSCKQDVLSTNIEIKWGHSSSTNAVITALVFSILSLCTPCIF